MGMVRLEAVTWPERWQFVFSGPAVRKRGFFIPEKTDMFFSPSESVSMSSGLPLSRLVLEIIALVNGAPCRYIYSQFLFTHVIYIVSLLFEALRELSSRMGKCYIRADLLSTVFCTISVSSASVRNCNMPWVT